MAVVETYGGTFANPGVIKKELTDAGKGVQQNGSRVNLPLIESANKSELDATTKITREKTLAMMLLNGDNFKRYAKV